MISEDNIQKCLDWLVEHAGTAAEIRGNRVYLEAYTKVVLAEEVKKSSGTSVSAKEQEAYASEAYKNHLLALQEVTEKDYWYQWMRSAAEGKIEAWRSMQANARAQGKIA